MNKPNKIQCTNIDKNLKELCQIIDNNPKENIHNLIRCLW